MRLIVPIPTEPDFSSI